MVKSPTDTKEKTMNTRTSKQSEEKASGFSPELLDELIGEAKTAQELLGRGGIIKSLSKALLERMLEGELSHHLGYEKYALVGKNSGNSRNGRSKKTLKGDFGELDLAVPRDRQASFEPVLVPKYETRFAEFDEKIISLYARGMSERDIAAQLQDLYGVEVSHGLISQVVSEVISEVTTWQNRGLDEVYPIVYFDALVVKVRQEKQVIKKHLYLALAINVEGDKELLGMWLAESEGAKFWLGVMNELKNRGLKDIFIACVEGLTGFPEAIEATFPHTLTQLCIVHMVRNSLQFVPWKARKEVARDLKTIYQAVTVEQAEAALVTFSDKWDAKYPMISQSWWRHWDNLTTFLALPPEIRKVIYTTNAVESLNSSFRKILKTKGSFPNDEAVFKLIYLAFGNIAKKWTRPISNWPLALNQFAILFPDRLPTLH
jgi:putative transposase